MRHQDLPRAQLPRGEFSVSDLDELVINYSGDLDGLDCGDVPRSVHMAFAIALTNVDQAMAFEDAKRDTLDSLAQAWRAILPDGHDAKIEYSRSATSVEIVDNTQN